MITYPVSPNVWPGAYNKSAWSLQSVLDDPYATEYPVSGDDIKRWRRAINA